MKSKLKNIIKQANEIDTEKAANQVLQWVLDNVEQFIDNQRKIYKIDIALDHEEGVEQTTMPELKKLQDLYQAIPEDENLLLEAQRDGATIENLVAKMDVEIYEEINSCRSALNEITQSIYNHMKGNPKLNDLFERMIFFYELKGINEGRLLIERFDGGTDILRFEYESFPMDVKVTAPQVKVTKADGSVEDLKRVTKEYVIPEGFTIWIEISYRSRLQNTTLF